MFSQAPSEIRIGTQIWTTKNLDVSAFRNGDVIQEAKSVDEWLEAIKNKAPAFCYYDFDKANADIYGKLYNGYAVRDLKGLAPNGYHIPSSSEWTTLIDFLGGESTAGYKLKSITGWLDYKGRSGNGDNSSGFNAIPGGYCTYRGEFEYLDGGADWWCSLDNGEDVSECLLLSYYYKRIDKIHRHVSYGMAVRCIKDTNISSYNYESSNIDNKKYFPVTHPAWGTFMNKYAVWVNNKEYNFEGKTQILEYTLTNLNEGLYEFEISADNLANIVIDGKEIARISDTYTESQKISTKLENGNHNLRVELYNSILPTNKWNENAGGIAILIKDMNKETVFSTRDNLNQSIATDIYSKSLQGNMPYNANSVSNQIINVNSLPKLKKFVFTQVSNKIIPGISQETSLHNGLNPVDILGNLGIVSMFYQNGCYTDGTYNHKDYLVEKGVVNDVNGSENYEAYTIHAPNHRAVKFLASHHNAYIKFPTIEDYSVFILEFGDFRKIGDINASAISKTGYTHIPFIDISSIAEATTYVFIPKIERLSALHVVNQETEGAEINMSNLGKIYNIKYKVSGSPTDNIQNNSSKNKSLFSFISKDSTLGLIWQDIESNSIHLTEIDNNLLSAKTIEMPNPNGGFLAAATGNKKGEVFYVTIQDIKSNSSDLILSKYNTNNKTHSKNQLNTAQNAIDVNWFAKDVASLSYDKDTLLFAFSRTHHKSHDGLNHQSGTAILFESNSLNPLTYYGITTSHSFDNIAISDINGDFITVEMGDNYPRGLNFRRFQKNGLSEQAKCLYTYKTAHKNFPNINGKIFPAYNEISNSSMKYYKWSNDNNTYTELGNLIDTRDGYVLSFLGEPDPNGYSLNNKWMGGSYPRNVGFVKVNRNYTKTGSESYLSKGINETGGFFDYSGNWNVQNNYGVVWLTKYNEHSLESAKFLKNIKLNDNTLLFMWEKWHNGSYSTTIAQKTDYNGNAKGGLIDLGKSIRLDRKNDLLVKDNTLFIFSSSNTEHKLGIICIKLE